MMWTATRRLILGIGICLLLAPTGWCQLLDNNLQVVDLSDLSGDLPLNVNSSTKILSQTQDWEHSTHFNSSWPTEGQDSLGFPSVVKNDHGQNSDGKYYLYYSHHDPTSGIGAAVADSITGPYTKVAVANEIPVLNLSWTDSQVLFNPLYRPTGVPVDWTGHYSSPSVVWNENEQLWFMYFHYYNHWWGGAGGEPWSQNNPGLGQQMTTLATTPDLSSHDWTLWTDPVWAQVSHEGTVPVLPTTDEEWMKSQSSYHAIQRLPDGQWLAFMRGTTSDTGLPTVGFGTSTNGRNWNYFPENPTIAAGKPWTVPTNEYRPKFIGYLGQNGSGADEYLVAWAEHSHPNIIYSKTTDFITFERDPRGYATWGTGDGGIVSAWREGNQLFLFSGQYVHVMELTVVPGSGALPLCDFNGDNLCKVADIRVMMAQGDLVAGVPVGAGNQFDLNSNNIINQADLRQWLYIAATENGYASDYLRGDTDDVGNIFPAPRTVDVTDFQNLLKGFTGSCLNWRCGNFNGDNVVDITDFSNHFLPNFAATGGGTYGPEQSVPEPSTVLLLGLGAALLAYVFGREFLAT